MIDGGTIAPLTTCRITAFGLILNNSHGITLNHTEDINMVYEYSMFFHVLPWRIEGQWADIT